MLWLCVKVLGLYGGSGSSLSLSFERGECWLRRAISLKFKKAGRNLVLIPLSMKFSMNMAGILQYIISYVAQVPRRTYSLIAGYILAIKESNKATLSQHSSFELPTTDYGTTTTMIMNHGGHSIVVVVGNGQHQLNHILL